MSIIHLGTDNGRGGYVPLCNRADWESLTKKGELNECWECASIAGTEQPSDRPQPQLLGHEELMDRHYGYDGGWSDYDLAMGFDN